MCTTIVKAKHDNFRLEWKSYSEKHPFKSISCSRFPFCCSDKKKKKKKKIQKTPKTTTKKKTNKQTKQKNTHKKKHKKNKKTKKKKNKNANTQKQDKLRECSKKQDVIMANLMFNRISIVENTRAQFSYKVIKILCPSVLNDDNPVVHKICKK